MSSNAQIIGKRPGDEKDSALRDSSGRIASTGKRLKIAKGLNKKDEAEPEEDVLTSILPLRLTAHSGYLPLKDAGRFLLRVGKDMTASIFEDRVSGVEAVGGNGGDGAADDGEDEAVLRLRRRKIRNEVWKTLCEIKWRNPKVLKHIASTLGGSLSEVDWESLCRKFLPQPAKPVVRASVDGYSFILSLFNCPREDKDVATPLSTTILKDEEAESFLKSGETDFLKLDDPVKIGNYASEERAQQALANEPMNSIFSTLHAIRKSDGKSYELNTQGGFHLDGSQADQDIYDCTWSTLVNIGKLHMLLDAEDFEARMDLSMDRSFLAVAKDDGNGRVDYYITQVGFSANLWGNDNSLSFGDLNEGVTYADFLELLDGWK